MNPTFATVMVQMPVMSGAMTAAMWGVCAVALLGVLVARLLDSPTSVRRIGLAALGAVAVAALFVVYPQMTAIVVMPCDWMGCWFDSIFW